MDTTKFSHSLFYSKFRKTWCMLTKCIAMNPKNHWVNKFLLLFFVFVILKVTDQIPSWKKMKEAFSVKLQTEKLCFCLRWKLNKIQAAQIKNKNVVFKHFHQNIRGYLGPPLGKYCILGRVWPRWWVTSWEVVTNKFGLS